MADGGSKQIDFLNDVVVKNVMRAPVVTVFVDDPLSKAEEMFVSKKVFYLPVVRHNRTLVGILTQKYIYKIQSPRRIISDDFEQKLDTIVDGGSVYYKEILDSYILKNVMYPDPSEIHEDGNMAQVVRMMSKKNIGCVTVVDDNEKVCGILTNRDVINFIASYM